MKPFFFILLTTISLTTIRAQTQEILQLDTCYFLAEKNYPMIKMRELIEKTKDHSMINATKGFFPSVTVHAQQSYQSDVTRIPVAGENNGIPVQSKDQYKIHTDINAPIYDGDVIKTQKQMHEVNAKIDDQNLDIELYKLKDRVNQLFFGILLLEGQLEQNRLLTHDIELGLNKTNALILNGTALKSSADVLMAELLKAKQAYIEISSNRTVYLEMLSLLIGQPIGPDTELKKPTPISPEMEIRRPELRLYEFQSEAINIQMKMLSTRIRPKLSVFLQAGYGRPALNMLDNQADSYYVGGVKLNWALSGFYTLKKEKEILELNRRTINIQRETFLFSTDYLLTQQRTETYKLSKLIATDDDIIILRNKVKRTASSQLESGVITTNDYLREVSAENQARQLRVLHEIQLLLAQYTLQTTTGI